MGAVQASLFDDCFFCWRADDQDGEDGSESGLVTSSNVVKYGLLHRGDPKAETSDVVKR